MTNQTAAPALEAAAPMAAATATRQRERDGQVLMLAGGVLLGTIGVFVEEAGQDPATTVWCRCAFGLAALLSWGAVTGRLPEVTRLRGTALAAVLGAGALMVTSWGLFFAAIPLCSIAVSTVVFHLQPFWLMALGSCFLGERVGPAQWGAAAVALAGLALASGVADHGLGGWLQSGDPVRGEVRGVVLSLVGSLVYAASAFTAQVATQRHGNGVSSFALASGQCAVGALVLLAWPLMNGLPAAGPAWAWLVGLGVLHTGLAYVVVFAGMARLSTAHTAVLQFVYPGTAVLVDWAVYGRALGGLQVGGVLLMAGALWALRRPGARRRAVHPQAG